MDTPGRLRRHGTLAAVVATGVVGLAALATSPADAAPVPTRATVMAPSTVFSTISDSAPVSASVATAAGLPALPVLAPRAKPSTTRVDRLGSCSAAMMDL